jgi:hypothetical protein
MSDDRLDDLNDLVAELKNTKTLTGIMAPPVIETENTVPEKITDDNIDDFIYRKSATLIQQGVDTIEAMKTTMLRGAEAETVDAYSKLMNSVATSIEILNKINLQKRKEKAAKELKQMDLDSSAKLLDKYDGTSKITNQTNNIIIASREEIMKALVGKAEAIIDTPLDVLDATSK